MFSKKGFTLAEVLITLGIIGVVAAMTIPTIINDAQDAQFKSAWKKQFSVFSQASTSILIDNGGSFKNIVALWDNNALRDLYSDKVKYIKTCAANDWYGGKCWADHVYTGYGLTKFLNGTSVHSNEIPLGNGNAGAVLPDGTNVLFAYQDNTCTSQNTPGVGYEGLTNVCGWISVDVNGVKGPNIVGRDIFGMFLLENKVVPYGTKNFSGTCNTSGRGLGCSSQYISQ